MEMNQLMAAISSVQVQPELRQPVHGNEEVCLIAAVENRQIKNSSFEDLKDVLKLIMVKVGLRSQNWPDDSEKAVIVSHILTQYGTHTCEEVKLAFDMAIAGKLIFGKDESANCYENFSCLYFSSVMNAYRRWAEQVLRYLDKTPKTNEVQKIYSDEEILNERRGQIESAFQAMKRGYYPILHTYFKEILVADGFMDEDVTIGEFFVEVLNRNIENIYKKQYEKA